MIEALNDCKYAIEGKHVIRMKKGETYDLGLEANARCIELNLAKDSSAKQTSEEVKEEKELKTKKLTTKGR